MARVDSNGDAGAVARLAVAGGTPQRRAATLPPPPSRHGRRHGCPSASVAQHGPVEGAGERGGKARATPTAGDLAAGEVTASRPGAPREPTRGIGWAGEGEGKWFFLLFEICE